MTILGGFIYTCYFILLGLGARMAYNFFKSKQLIIESKTELIAHGFFQGVFVHVVLFNLFQYLNCTTSILLTLLGMILMASFILMVWQIKNGVSFSFAKVNLTQSVLITILLFTATLFIYWNGHMLPNIAWDSWAVWEDRADQWIEHGLSTSIFQWNHWLANNQSIYNQAANYPDGLSLIYYLPKLIWHEVGFDVTHVVYLCAFVLMTLLLVKRMAKFGASIYLQAFMVTVIYTTPFISSHLMIQGYADIWMAMYIVLIMLTLMDYKETGNSGIGMTLLCYLFMLPMLKLEGWVWLLLFILAYCLVKAFNSTYKYRFMIAFVLVFLIVASGLINLSLPFGDLIISHQRLTIFKLVDTPIEFVNITNEILISFFWQNNWSILWLGLPFLLISFFTQRPKESDQMAQARQVAQIFFIAALLSFLFLFYFTEASHWAIDFTAINRLVLQLTPCYLYLLFRMLTQLEKFDPRFKANKNKKTQVIESSPTDENSIT